MRLAALSGALWQLRNELERLQFKMDEIGILLDARRPWWLVMVADDTRRILDEVGRLEQRCMEQLERASAELDPAAERPVTLRSVASHAPEPWNGVLTDHLAAITDLRNSVRMMALAAEPKLCDFDFGELDSTGEDELTREVLHIAVNALVAMALYAGGPPASTLLR